MRLAYFAFAAALMSAPALAQPPGVAAPEAAAAAPQQPAEVPPVDDARVNQLIIYGDDPCPQSSAEEIIVCARLPEDDRFRIPPELRGNPNDPANQSWTNRAIELSYVGRSGIGSCSPSGAGGMIGCFNQMVQQARAERANRDEVNWNALIEEAREERMRRIGEAALEEEDPQPE
ncbi:hypothetical protein [Sphingosinicella sp. CPCC 101087]|uniref:hypothetical protein n=1 Tax=Sphingosinicella sp. CPCC 101087 TaxID=2497754 RepID=UPI00101CDAD9|nr:hypothetical protein [Sphingosinicella sp. CPCC 101087]